MKKLVSLLLCLALAVGAVFTVAACEKTKDSEGTSETATSSTGSGTDTPETKVYIGGAVQLPANIIAYQGNSSVKENDPAADPKYRQTEFFVTGREYVVGDDNAFRFKPAVNFVDDLDLPVAAPADWTFDYSLEVKEGDDFVSADETYFDSVDNVACEFDFSAKAVGKTVRLSVTPDGLTEAQEANKAAYTATFEFNVVDGYNVYNSKEMAYMSNSPAAIAGDGSLKATKDDEHNEAQAGWKTVRDDNGLTLNPNDVKALILHNNITLTSDDIAQSMLISAEEVRGHQYEEYLVGSLHDYSHVGVYHRIIAPGDQFVIEGNYFTLDAQSIPVTYDHTDLGKNIKFNADGEVEESGVISHIQLFFFETLEYSHKLHAIGLEKNELNDTDTYAAIRNLSVIGNSPRTEDKAAQGGLIFEKNDGIFFEVDNMISKKFFITLFSQGEGSGVYRNVKVFDSYNSPVFVWGQEDVRINNLLSTNSGGPGIICTMYKYSESTVNRSLFPHIVATDCVFDNPVSGDEAWFALVGASALVPQIKAIDEPLKASLHRGFLKDNKMNIYAIVLNDSGYKFPTNDISVYVEINGNVIDYGKGAKEGDKCNAAEGVNPAMYSATLNGTLVNAGGQGAPVLETSGGGLMYIGENYTPGYPNAEWAPYLALGDMLNLYYNTGAEAYGFLGVAFEYYPMQAA
ncbi:MAG: hypothetical protein IJU84_06350 [Clostridia bacterium]|nr:hypothetical protein [Clostridia bacterium]